MQSESRIFNLPKVLDRRGNLTFIEGLKHIPFEIQRTFWIYDVPGGEIRGGHAYKTSEEFVIALSGSFDVVLKVESNINTITLNRSYYGLYIEKGTWRHMENFSTNAVALVLSSTLYDENDYIRNFSDFLQFSRQNGENLTANLITSPSEPTLHETIRSTVADCFILDLGINHRDGGNITVFENQKTLPFNINRVYYLYDIPGGETRGGHAHRNLEQLVIAASGSFDILLDDGKSKQRVTLNRPHQCLHIVPGIWREIRNFSSGSICLVLASLNYDEADYLRDYNDFGSFKNSRG